MAAHALGGVDSPDSLFARSVIHVWTYMDPARLQQVGWIRIVGHNC